jgi:hypothetical protein
VTRIPIAARLTRWLVATSGGLTRLPGASAGFTTRGQVRVSTTLPMPVATRHRDLPSWTAIPRCNIATCFRQFQTGLVEFLSPVFVCSYLLVNEAASASTRRTTTNPELLLQDYDHLQARCVVLCSRAQLRHGR